MTGPGGNPPALRQLQQVMAGRIRRQAIDDTSLADALAWITVPDGDDPRQRLAIYVDGYPARMHEALREAFPAIAHIVGAPGFIALVDRYCSTVDSRAMNLNAIGEEFPPFLHSDISASGLPFLPDLARLEWLVQRAFHAPREAPIEPAAMRPEPGVAWENVRLRFQPSLGVLRSAWPVLDLWQARETPREEIDIELVDRPQAVLVQRNGFEVHAHPIEDAEAFLLEALLSGASLSAAIESASRRPFDPARVTEWFASWMATGKIMRIERSGS